MKLFVSSKAKDSFSMNKVASVWSFLRLYSISCVALLFEEL